MRQAGPPPPLRISPRAEPPAPPHACPAPAPPPPAPGGPQTRLATRPRAGLGRDTPRARLPRPRCTAPRPRGLPWFTFIPARPQADPGPPRSVLRLPEQVPRVETAGWPLTLALLSFIDSDPRAGYGAAKNGRGCLGLGVGHAGARAPLLMATQL